jgi:hypothetical protein
MSGLSLYHAARALIGAAFEHGGELHNELAGPIRGGDQTIMCLGSALHCLEQKRGSFTHDLANNFRQRLSGDRQLFGQ